MRETDESRRQTVLLIDDDPEVHRLTRLQLRADFEVIGAEGGHEGVEIARRSTPNAILLDMKMPDLDGLGVLAALASDPSTREIPVIFLSAHSEVEDRVDGLQQGAADYIAKPADQRELLARLSGVIRRNRRKSGQAYDLDPVSQLPGRVVFVDRLTQEAHRSDRSSAPFSVLLIDVDNLPHNAGPGFQGADRLLRQIARAATETLRASDLLFRYGPNQFSAILPDCDAGTAWIAAERLRTSVVGLEDSSITLSIGIAEHTVGRDAEELLRRAGIALARAKESGGDMSWRADDPRRLALNPAALSNELTDREWEVLAHLARRRTEDEIATRLDISAGTVRSHKSRIRRKLHVSPDSRLTSFVRENFGVLSVRLTRTRAWHGR